jgi:chromosome segregation ATPase
MEKILEENHFCILKISKNHSTGVLFIIQPHQIKDLLMTQSNNFINR